MSRTWVIPDVAERDYDRLPSIWWCVVAFIIIQTAGILITVLTWEQGKPVMSGLFFVRALLMPLLVWGAVCGIIYSGYEDSIGCADWWNFLCRSAHVDWRYWTQAHVAIVRSIALTPEPELAERLLGLEGSPPANPGAVLSLPAVDGAAGVSRLSLIVEQLLTPLAGSVSRLAQSRTVEVILQSAAKDDLTELRTVWQKLNLSDLVQFEWLPCDAEHTRIETWFEDGWSADFRLLVACQLHEEEAEPSWSEAAVAMLLARPSVIDSFKGKLRPQARLFRPIPTPADSVEESLGTLLTAGQTPRARIRNGWLGGLSPQGRHAVTGAVRESGLDLQVHDVDCATGRPGPVNPLLLQALAAQMVAHGQGTQLVAAPAGQRLTLNLVGVNPLPVPEVEPPYMRMLSLSVTAGVSCVLVLMMFLLEAAGASPAWFWTCMSGFFLMFLIQAGGSILRRRLLEDDFRRALWRSGARA